ncbi:MAG: dihydrodipicolinate synthase family protein [Pseudomonadota bacterium]
MKIVLPDEKGLPSDYSLIGTPIEAAPLGADPARGTAPARFVFSAAHVVADPFTANDPSGPATVDWDATMAFRRHLAGLGIGIAEAMDTAQRGMGLDWKGALELITRTRSEVPDALVFNGAGTDQLDPADAKNLDDVKRAYLEQIEAIQKVDGRIILMASRALARFATSPDDYRTVYRDVLAACDQPVILHWLGEMFDPALAGYWGSSSFETTMETALAVIEENAAKVDGIKISLLDKEKEIVMRRRLPGNVKMYTGDDFNYPELIAGDEQGFSHALLGIFDPLAVAVGKAIGQLGEGDVEGFRKTLDPTVPLARLIFRAPTQYYKTGVVFLAWLNGHQDHFVMLGGAQSMRPLPYFTETFRLADQCGLLRDPELAVKRMKSLLAVYGA